jgi:Arc/MetJ family transcription regulator
MLLEDAAVAVTPVGALRDDDDVVAEAMLEYALST